MKIDLIKKQIRKKAVRYLPALAILLVIFIAAFQYKSYNDGKLEESANKVNSLNSQILKIESDYQESEKLLKIYLAIPKNKFPTDDGYSVGRDRLRVLLPIIQSLKDIYSFKTLNINLTEIKQNQEAGIQNYRVFENAIKLDFAGLTDELIFSFIRDLKQEIPGYVNIKTMNIDRKLDLNSSTADSYFSTNGAPVVTGEMELEWITLAEAAKVDAGQPGNTQNPNDPVMQNRPGMPR